MGVRQSNRSLLPHQCQERSQWSRFYDFELDGRPVTLEPFLSKIESFAKPILEKVLRADSLAGLVDEDRAMLATFFSIQLTRTRTFREQWSDFPRMLREHFEASGDQVATNSQAAELLRDMTENDSKAETGRFMLQAPRSFAQHFVSKDWVLAATTHKHPFVISDNPLALQNMIDRPHSGNLGLTMPGIEIYLPLSPVRALAMWCPTLTNNVRRISDEYQRGGIGFPGGGLNGPEGILALNEALSTGRPVAYSKENVENFNSLQIGRSERYVFSSANDFHLAREMLRSHPNLKRGPRMQAAR